MHTIYEARQEVEKCLERAKELFGFNADVDISFDKRGRIAGMAHNSPNGYALKFNHQLLENEHWGELIDETIPHEVAHIVCYFNPTLGKNHDQGWRRVCRMLGGRGDRTHNMPLKRARVTRKALYEINGKTVHVGLTVHRRIQQGRAYNMRSAGRIHPTDFTGQIIKMK